MNSHFKLLVSIATKQSLDRFIQHPSLNRYFLMNSAVELILKYLFIPKLKTMYVCMYVSKTTIAECDPRSIFEPSIAGLYSKNTFCPTIYP